jgi:hypothetical protein
VPWIAIIAWLAAVVLAVVALGFCLYELTWKARRLGRDLAQVKELGDTLIQLRDEAGAAQQRLARTHVG